MPARPDDAAIRTPLENPSNSGRGQRSRSAGRAILATVASDLIGVPVDVVSDKLLGLHDHEHYGDHQDEARGSLARSGARNFHRYKSRGRDLLRQLGVWPWCLEPNGKLPVRWWTQAPFLEPLRKWHEQAVDEAQEATDATRRAQTAFRTAPASHVA